MSNFFSVKNPALILQVRKEDEVPAFFRAKNVHCEAIGEPVAARSLAVKHKEQDYKFDIDALRDVW